MDNSSRSLHGALLDAEILAEVYLAMTGGQVALGLSIEADAGAEPGVGLRPAAERPALRVLRASPEEAAAHRQRLEAIRDEAGECLWDAL